MATVTKATPKHFTVPVIPRQATACNLYFLESQWARVSVRLQPWEQRAGCGKQERNTKFRVPAAAVGSNVPCLCGASCWGLVDGRCDIVQWLPGVHQWSMQPAVAAAKGVVRISCSSLKSLVSGQSLVPCPHLSLSYSVISLISLFRLQIPLFDLWFW